MPLPALSSATGPLDDVDFNNANMPLKTVRPSNHTIMQRILPMHHTESHIIPWLEIIPKSVLINEIKEPIHPLPKCHKNENATQRAMIWGDYIWLKVTVERQCYQQPRTEMIARNLSCIGKTFYASQFNDSDWIII